MRVRVSPPLRNSGRVHSLKRMTSIKAVLWDFGGVLTTSPFETFRRFERENGYPADFIRRINSHNPDENAWARLERSEISVDDFDRLFNEEATALGHALPGKQVLSLLAGDLRPTMVQALKTCTKTMKTACLTNNIAFGKGPGMSNAVEAASEIANVMKLFDFVIESSKVGVRKPDPRFYQSALDALKVSAEECVYLDDLGINLKPARAMGIQTIKVVEPDRALAELEQATGLTLTGG